MVDLVAEARELPDPELSLLTHNERELVRFAYKLADEIDRLRAKTEWQPISTAPRDGTESILYFPSYHENNVSVMAYNDATDSWDGIRGYQFDDGDDAPTHWMPLPEAPKGEE